MEYATNICSDIYDDQFMKHVGFDETLCIDECEQSCLQEFFSQKNISKISCKVTQLLTGVDKLNRPIVVPDRRIANVMSGVYESFRPETGSIFSRYTIPVSRGTDWLQRMIDETINIITSNVRDTLEMQYNNENLTIWTTVLGDFNEHGLRSHAPIKLKERRPSTMLFNMNY